ncbi:dipeptidylpeptidase [Phlyctochytrium planicorne]|nr:dipeptidylpeptidase [Phlyctochytrium planicorne]
MGPGAKPNQELPSDQTTLSSSATERSSSGLSWDGVRTKVREFHSTYTSFPSVICKEFTFDDHHQRLFFLANVKPLGHATDTSFSDNYKTTPYMNLLFCELEPPFMSDRNPSHQPLKPGSDDRSAAMDLLESDMMPSNSAHDRPEIPSGLPHSSPSTHHTVQLKIRPLLSESWKRTSFSNSPEGGSGETSKEKSEIPFFQIWTGKDRSAIMFPRASDVFYGAFGETLAEFSPQAIPFTRSVSRVDPKLGGTQGNLIAYVCNRNIWVTSPHGNEVQLTERATPHTSNGIAEYIMQEEFHRLTGFWWQPPLKEPAKSHASHEVMERILYVEVDESPVELVCIARPGLDRSVDTFRYARAGKANALEDIKIATFTFNTSTFRISSPVTKGIFGDMSLNALFPWVEYIPRLGWLPDGSGVWAQLLDRRQQRTALIEIPLEQFMSEDEYQNSSFGYAPAPPRKIIVLHEEVSEFWINVTDIMHFFPSSIGNTHHNIAASAGPIVYPTRTIRKITSGTWQVVDQPISVDAAHKIVYYTAKADGPLENHLYASSFDERCTIPIDPSVRFKEVSEQFETINRTRMTRLGQSHTICINSSCTFYLAISSSSSERPTYEIFQIHHPNSPDPKHSRPNHINKRYHYTSQSDTSDEDCLSTTDLPESLGMPPISSFDSQMFGFAHEKLERRACSTASAYSGQKRRSSAQTLDEYTGDFYLPTSQLLAPIIERFPPAETAPSHWKPEFFSFLNSDGIELFGMIFKPRNFQDGKKYPIIVRIYGGPNVQVVTNDYKYTKLMRVFLSLHFGYIVVLLDSRGSYDRGLEFEGYIRHRMGTVELHDQIEGLLYLFLKKSLKSAPLTSHFLFEGMAKWDLDEAWRRVLAASENGFDTGCFDMKRLGITGWSYGGYLSLMALAQYPHVFKVALSGAPVTSWELYDTAYTERYMGLPNENIEGYRLGSVLNYVDKFPESDCRLLIIHGSIDENVHFKNTEALVSELVRASKPHRVQVYPGERHGLRAPNVIEHFETLMMWTFLQMIPP